MAVDFRANRQAEADMVADALRSGMGDWALMSGYRGTSMGVAPSASAMGSYRRTTQPQLGLLGQQMDWWRMKGRWTDEAIERAKEQAALQEREGLVTDLLGLGLGFIPKGKLYPGMTKQFSQVPDPYAEAVESLLGRPDLMQLLFPQGAEGGAPAYPQGWDPLYGGSYAPPPTPQPAPEPYGGWTA